jgi:hypothetical protein
MQEQAWSNTSKELLKNLQEVFSGGSKLVAKSPKFQVFKEQENNWWSDHN